MCQNSQNDLIDAPLLDLALVTPVTGSATNWEPCSDIPPHYHRTAQLIYASEGVITVEIEHGIWVVPPTRAVWVPAQVSHSIHMSGRVLTS